MEKTETEIAVLGLPHESRGQSDSGEARAKMPRTGLNRLASVRRILVAIRRLWLTKIFGMQIDRTAEFSLSADFDKTYPKGVFVNKYSYIAKNVTILTHDRTRGIYTETRVGRCCFIGAGSIILPGVNIGDNVVVGAGSVVTNDVPKNCLVAGNPAKIIRPGIEVGKFGRLNSADATEEYFAKNVA